MLQKLFITVFLGCLLSGCITSPIMGTNMSDEELAARFKSSPIVRLSVKQLVTTRKDQVEIYYHNFDDSSPNRILNWEYHYKIAERSEPAWPYQEIGEIELWVAERDDEKNLESLKDAASKYGADAVTELFRKPINTFRQHIPKEGEYMLNEFGIGGYLYYGKLVKKKS